MFSRFQKVGGSKTDVVTVSLYRLRGNPSGDVSGPVQSANGSISVEITDRPLTAEQAFIMGIRLSMRLGVPLVVQDPDSLWNPDWSRLYI
jgi:hypothetical protein